MEKMGLLATDENGTTRATVAGILLCSEAPEQWLPNACITATCYQGKDRASGQIDAQTIGGPLNRQIEQALAFVLRNMRVAARKEPAREDLPQYSTNALFEAMVNAVIHRDYSVSGSRTRLSMFVDRTEIWSPGGLPNNLTIESMGERQATRNEALASLLRRIHVEGIEGTGGRRFFMERRGDGVPMIMRRTQELSGKRPEYRLIDGSELCLTIPAASLENSPATVTITVRSGGRPVEGVDLLALFPNNTWKRATTDGTGEMEVSLHSVHLPMTVFAAAAGFAARNERGWVPSQRALALETGCSAQRRLGHFPRGHRQHSGPGGASESHSGYPRQNVSLCLQHRHQRRTASTGPFHPGRGHAPRRCRWAGDAGAGGGGSGPFGAGGVSPYARW